MPSANVTISFNDASNNFGAFFDFELAQIGAPAAPKAPTVGNASSENVASKYAIDNKVVKVTYGEKGNDYKSLLLNFNDYAVTVTVGGEVYNLAGYGYAVIYH